MMINRNLINKLSFRVPILTLIFGLSIVGLTVSCEKEDDLPPPSAYVPPEPDENCPDGPVATDIYNGIEFACEIVSFTVFGDNDGANPYTVTVVDNPDKSGINTSPKVVQVDQAAGVQGWAGMFFDLDAKIDFNENQGFKIKVWSPAAGQVVNVKLEDKASEGGIAKEVATTTTVANEWEELTVNFTADDSDKFDRIVLFFNFNGDKDAATTHYFDGITLGEKAVVVLPEAPTAGAPAPTVDGNFVISVFSDAYTDLADTDFNPNWAQGTVVTVEDIAGNATLKYATLNYQGTQFAAPVDVSGMDFMHIDYWTSDSSTLNISLISSGPAETPVSLTVPTEGEWVSVDIPLSEFSSVVDLMDVIQLKFDGNGTIYLDNIFFYSQEGVSTDPQSAAPAPTRPAGSVISMFSDVYDDVVVDTWRTDWSVADFEDVTIQGDAVKKYSALGFVGIETTSNQIDATNMTHFHLDIWTPDATEFKVKLVDFGADGAYDGGDDVEHELTFANPAQGEWVSLDIPLSDFTGLTTRANIAQLIFVGAPYQNTTVFVDNVYFYADVSEPQSAAPTPTQAAADVISMFSDAYDDVVVDTWRTDWSDADFEDVTIAGNAVKKYSNLGFVGIETVANQLDVTDKTHFRVDIWTADATEIKIKLVDFGANGAYDGGGDDVEHELTFANPAQGEWVSFDIPLSDFTGLTTRANIAQLIFVGAPWKANTIYVDNVYFY